MRIQKTRKSSFVPSSKVDLKMKLTKPKRKSLDKNGIDLSYRIWMKSVR